MKPYRLLSHTGDIRLLITGKNLEELFAHAGYAFFDITWDLAEVEERLFYPIKIEEEGRAELLVAFLRELLYLNQAEEYIFKRFEVQKLVAPCLEVVGFGEKIDLARHRGKREFKAVTYHQAEVSEKRGRFTAKVIFDI